MNPIESGAQFGSTGFQPVPRNLTVSRRNLPHVQTGGSVYFVTFRTKSLVLSEAERMVVLDACVHFDGVRYLLWAAVVMPDHVHLLLQPAEQSPGEWWSLTRILHSIKSFSAKGINQSMGRSGPVWQAESFDRIVRDEAELIEKWNYIRGNPAKAGLCRAAEAWDGLYERTGTGKMPVLPDG